jgi:hypothetical protein
MFTKITHKRMSVEINTIMEIVTATLNDRNNSVAMNGFLGRYLQRNPTTLYVSSSCQHKTKLQQTKCPDYQNNKRQFYAFTNFLFIKKGN